MMEKEVAEMASSDGDMVGYSYSAKLKKMLRTNIVALSNLL